MPQLLDPQGYRPCEWDLKADRGCLRYWVGVFVEHADRLLASIADSYPDASPEVLADLRQRYLRTMREFEERPEAFTRIDILVLDAARDRLLREYGFVDPFAFEKRRANARALAAWPAWVARLDRTAPAEQLELICRGLLAGNMFDLGAAAATECYERTGADFASLMKRLPQRPWLRDDVDRWGGRWRGNAYRHAAVFVDNAGADFCLGCLGLARWCGMRGTRVTLAANERPALNDVTAAEARELIAAAAEADEVTARLLADGVIRVVSTGNDTPLIDLGALGEECVAAVGDADLVLLVGMGRALESNYRARLSCDTVRIAVLKDRAVAAWLGGKLFDCLVEFRAPG